MGNSITSKRAKKNLFEIGFRGYYHEFSEDYSEHVRATDDVQALKVFCRRHRIRMATPVLIESVVWWDGDWMMKVRYVKGVNSFVCPHCCGSGVIHE